MKRIHPILGLVATAMLLASCSLIAPAKPTATPSPVATSTAAPSATAIPSPTVATSSGPSIFQPAATKAPVTNEAILARTSDLRGLPVKAEVPFATLARAELRPYLIKSFEKDNGKEDLEKTKALWTLLDLIGEREDLYDLWLGLLSEQVAGFYELDSRSMKLIGGGGALATQDEITLAHEYVHALQDQQFNIGASVKQAKRDGEKSLALKALIEGDATLAMADYANRHVSRDALATLQNDASSLNMQKLSSAPLVLQVDLLFPYQQGTAFVASLFRSGGWAAVNKAYANPPVTSEQIIHPEKYIAGEGPKRVDLPDIAPALGSQWSKLESNTIGELGWLVYLAMGLDVNDVAMAAMGWGGDQYVLYRSGTGKHALAVLSAWDTADDADEFFYAIYDLQDTHATTKYSIKEDTRFAWTRAATSGYAALKGQQVLLVITPDEATTKKIVERFNGF